MIEVSVRVDYGYRLGRESGDGRADLSYSQACVEKQRALFTKNQIGDDFFKLLRFVDGKHARLDAVDFKPRFIAQNAI